MIRIPVDVVERPVSDIFNTAAVARVGDAAAAADALVRQKITEIMLYVRQLDVVQSAVHRQTTKRRSRYVQAMTPQHRVVCV
jgi:hypothetical protein